MNLWRASLVDMSEPQDVSSTTTMALQIKDLAGLSQPLTKAIEVISAGMGTLYRPTAMRRETQAKAYDIVTVAKAEANAQEIRRDIEMAGVMGRIERIAQDQPELAHRARQRLLQREIEGQLNIEAIAAEAIKLLPDAVSDEPVSADWRRKFFMEADNICSADLQVLWGKVLAGEIATPGAFSLRTLEVLKNLSQREARLFSDVCGMAMQGGWIAQPGNDINTAFTPFGLTYDSIMELRDAGLLQYGDGLWRKFEFQPNSFVHLANNGVLMAVLMVTDNAQARQIPSLSMTTAGKEIQRLIEPAPNEEYLKLMATHLRSMGIAVKRGRPTPTSDGAYSVFDFESDL